MSEFDDWENVVKPPDADEYAWELFAEYAKADGVGSHPDDYGSWWSFWKAGYQAAINDLGG